MEPGAIPVSLSGYINSPRSGDFKVTLLYLSSAINGLKINSKPDSFEKILLITLNVFLKILNEPV